MSVWDRVAEALEREEPGVLLTCVAGEPLGAKLVVLESGERVGDETLAPYAGARVTGTVEEGGRTVLAELIGPPLHLLIFGAVDMAVAEDGPPHREAGAISGCVAGDFIHGFLLQREATR